MKCYYEVLDVSQDVDDDNLRKSYRKLALKWHPDKNPDNKEEANREFLLIQRAYEVLSDPHERTWYDKHRESILKGAGSGYEDESLDVMAYFNTSCYKGMDDSENGFYTVYREVFNRLAAEESEYLDDGDNDPPEFGNSESVYEDVNKFYGFWRSFCTKKSYSWLYEYDIQEAENRRILRLMEQENKKIREKAKKERNEEIRELIEFVRKRDKRVEKHAEYLKKKVAENNRKAEEHRKRMIQQRKQELGMYQESEWSKFSNLEKELQDIENSMANEFDDRSDSEFEIDELLCAACNKSFRTEKAFENHEKSRKHQENVAKLKRIMLDEEEMNGGGSREEQKTGSASEETIEDELKTVEELEKCTVNIAQDSRNKSKKKKNKQIIDVSIDELEETELHELACSKKQKKKLNREKILQDKFENKTTVSENCDKKAESNSKEKKPERRDDEESVVETDLSDLGSKKQKKKQEKEKKLKENPTNSSDRQPAELIKSNISKKDKKGQKNGSGKSNCESTAIPKLSSDQIESLDLDHSCATCCQSFKSKNKLFQHLSTSGHSIYLSSKAKPLLTKPNKKKK